MTLIELSEEMRLSRDWVRQLPRGQAHYPITTTLDVHEMRCDVGSYDLHAPTKVPTKLSSTPRASCRPR